jgi:NAD(P)-dependent dehydrogenase (short-subunit alcohol dehydrogenase family)
VPWVSTSSARPLSGQVAVVTGASSGLGQATAHQLAADGAAVAVLARSRGDLISTRTRITELGGTALALPTDLADVAAIESVVSSVAAEFGRIDVLVNAAATDVPGPVEDLDRHGWDRVIAVNLTAPFLLAKAVWLHMRRAGGGTIDPAPPHDHHYLDARLQRQGQTRTGLGTSGTDLPAGHPARGGGRRHSGRGQGTPVGRSGCRCARMSRCRGRWLPRT